MTNNALWITIRIGSESDHTSDSDIGSNVRTDVRTNAADPYGHRSGLGSRRACAYEKQIDLVVSR